MSGHVFKAAGKVTSLSRTNSQCFAVHFFFSPKLHVTLWEAPSSLIGANHTPCFNKSDKTHTCTATSMCCFTDRHMLRCQSLQSKRLCQAIVTLDELVQKVHWISTENSQDTSGRKLRLGLLRRLCVWLVQLSQTHAAIFHVLISGA